MIEAGILRRLCGGEKAAHRLQREIVVAMIGDEATVKRYYKENGMFRLQPENRSMQPIFTTGCPFWAR